MSQRGGSVLTHLKIGPFHSPLVKKGGADILLSLEKDEALKTLHFLRPAAHGRSGGLCFINAPDPNDINPQIKNHLKENGIQTFIFGASRMAKEMGSVQSANIALIGFAAAHPGFPFSHDRLAGVVERIAQQRVRETSLKIFEKGFSEGRKILKFNL